MSARTTDPWTSKAAAHSIQNSAHTQREIIMDAYRAHPDGLTDEEAASHAGVGGCWWKRCSELRALGMIVDTGQVRIGISGRARIVCTAANFTTLFPMEAQ